MPWTTPTTVSTGDVLTASRYNADVQANLTELAPFFSAWTSVAATTCTQSGAITLTNSYNKYLKVGRLVIWSFRLVYSSGTGSAGTSFTLTLPVNAVSASDQMIGSGVLYDSSATRPYAGSWIAVSASTIQLRTDDTVNAFWGFSPSIAFTTSDTCAGICVYEAAS